MLTHHFTIIFDDYDMENINNYNNKYYGLLYFCILIMGVNSDGLPSLENDSNPSEIRVPNCPPCPPTNFFFFFSKINFF